MNKITKQLQRDGEYEVFVQKNERSVIRYLAEHCRCKEDAEDIASQVFLYCYTHWDSYNFQKASRRTWLFVIVRSKWIDFYRKRKNSVSLDDLVHVVFSNDDVIEQALQLTELRDRIAYALTMIPEQQRLAIILRYFKEESIDRIAERLKTTPGNVRVLLSRGLKRMKPILDEYLG